MNDVLAVEAAIRQLHARYIDAVWRRDADAFVDCFAEQAEWKIAGRHLRGRGEIRAAFEAFMQPSERVLMSLGTPVLEVGAGVAVGRTPATELIKRRDGGVARTVGVYHERFVETGDGWRFAWRHWSYHYYGPPDFSADFFDSPDYGPPPAMPAADEPTLVRPNSETQKR